MFHRLGKNGARYWGKQAAGILFTDGKSVLLLRRKKPSDHAGTWATPGGKLKDHETAIDCARRECKEETGHVAAGQRFGDFEEVDGRFRYTCYLFAVDKQFDCDLNDEHDDWKWVPIDELGDYDLHPNLKKVMPVYKKAIFRRFPPKKFSEWLSNR